MSSFEARVTASFSFEAAHWMPNFPEGHPNRRLHGHSYGVEIAVRGPVQPTSGVVIDHGDLVEICTPFIQELDHSCLNEISGLELPTSECLARWLWQRLSARLPLLYDITLRRPTCGVYVSYRGEGA